MNKDILGYGVFENVSGDLFVGYYESDDRELINDPENANNFYDQELEAAYAAIEILNERIKK